MANATELKTALLQETSLDIFAVSYLQLCRVSYDVHPSSIPADVADANTVYPWGDGHWQCTWGPALDPVQANLVYVATYYQGGLPVAVVVVNRGTNVTPDTWGDLWEAFEDLGVPFQSQLPWLADPKVLIADGTLAALDTVMGLTFNSQNLLTYLIATLSNPANEKPVLVVTGHSLGGCIASVAAPWLKVALKAAGVENPIVPVTFGALSAGNAGFANYFVKEFPFCPRYYNELDVMPMCWANLAGIKTAYKPCGLAIPPLAGALVDTWQGVIDDFGASYAQPATMRAPLQGACFTTSDWYAQKAFQHAPTTYLHLLGVTAPQTALATTVPARRNARITAARRAGWISRQRERTPGLPPIVPSAG